MEYLEMKNTAYAPAPKNPTEVKNKVIFNLTKRQLIYFAAGASVGVLCAAKAGASSAAVVMVVAILPTFLLVMYEYNG